LRIGILGDLHMHWSQSDLRWFSQAGYDLLLIVGDLASYFRDGRSVARSLARLPMPTLVMAGNHDGVSLPQLVAEALGQEQWCHRLGRGQSRRCRAMERALAPVPLVGYSLHPFHFNHLSLAVVAARPHSMGGPRLSFRRYLTERFGVGSLAESAQRLESLVDPWDGDRVIFLAHNGPTGLGRDRSDIWGCDFRASGGDFGDPDLGRAVAYARRQGKQVVAVVAGHMHHALHGGGQRRWRVEHDGVLYLNAARVPRVARLGGSRRRHHLLLRWDGNRAEVEPVWVD
jgi:uncharacterized protein (TIGR04168 family)